jgi:hypothetical protein
MRYSYTILPRKLEGKRLYGRPRHKEEDKWTLRK